MLKMSSTSLLVVSQPVSRTWDSFVNSSVTFNTETTFGLRLSFQKPLCRHAGTVDRQVQCVQNPMHLTESATASGSSQLQSSMKFESRN